MPTLTWIGKEKVVNHHREVPYRVPEHKYGYRSDDRTDTAPKIAAIFESLRQPYDGFEK